MRWFFLVMHVAGIYMVLEAIEVGPLRGLLFITGFTLIVAGMMKGIR